jgi:serine/threonine-protein kinase SRPK3
MTTRKITKKKNQSYNKSLDRNSSSSGENSYSSETDSYFDSDESLSEDDEYEVSQGIVGEIFSNKYICIKYLGKGTFSRVWLVYDLVTNNFLAMKMVYSKYSEDAEHEIEMYRHLGNKYNHVTRFYDNFIFNDQVCLITELMGICLLDFVKNYLNMKDMDKRWYDSPESNEVLPIELVKLIFKQLFTGLHELHSKNIVHTDIKPENIMLNIFPVKIERIKKWFTETGIKDKYDELVLNLLPDTFNNAESLKKKQIKKKCRIKALNLLKQDIKKRIIEYHEDILSEKRCKAESIIDIDNVSDIEVDQVDSDDLFTINSIDNLVCKIIDLGNAELVEDFEPEAIQLRCYRAPENVLFDFYNTKADIWTMGCMLFENLTGEFLFEIDHELYQDSLEKDIELLAQMYNTLGKMSVNDTYKSPYKEDFFINGTAKLKEVTNDRLEPTPVRELLLEGGIKDANLELLTDLFKKIFCYRHEDRIDAQEVLSHIWFNH